MRFASVLVPEAGRGSGPDLTRYLVVCAGSILVLLAVAWVFRRYVAAHLKVRASKRSLQVLDVLPLSGKQKLVVVRCYDRSFLLGLGVKAVRAIAELDGAALPRPASEAQSSPTSSSGLPFSAALDTELELQPARSAKGDAGLPTRQALGSKEGLLA